MTLLDEIALMRQKFDAALDNLDRAFESQRIGLEAIKAERERLEKMYRELEPMIDIPNAGRSMSDKTRYVFVIVISGFNFQSEKLDPQQAETLRVIFRAFRMPWTELQIGD
jgi:hypothetical protein